MFKSCRKCGTVVANASVCARCKQKYERTSVHNPAYDDPTYRRNREMMIRRAWRDRRPCVVCGQPFDSKRDITAEHIVPVRNGGTHAISNLGPAHGGCNSGWRSRVAMQARHS